MVYILTSYSDVLAIKINFILFRYSGLLSVWGTENGFWVLKTDSGFSTGYRKGALLHAQCKITYSLIYPKSFQPKQNTFRLFLRKQQLAQRSSKQKLKEINFNCVSNSLAPCQRRIQGPIKHLWWRFFDRVLIFFKKLFKKWVLF